MDREIDLIRYLPEILQEVREFRSLAAAENPEIEKLWTCLEDALNDQFVGSATTYGIKRWESILKIMPKATDSPDERRFRILTRLNEQLPYSWRMLVHQLTTLCGSEGYSIELKNNEYTLIVKVALTAKANFDDVGDLLGRIVPANLVIDLSLKYNQHELIGGFTHEQLAAYTHQELREEVITVKTYPPKTVTGLVWPMASIPDWIIEEGIQVDGFLDMHAITIELRSSFFTPANELKTKAVLMPDNAHGRFTLKNVPVGNYVLYIKRAGFLARCMNVSILPEDEETIELVPPSNEGRFELWSGDVNDDGIINNADKELILEAFNKDFFDAGYNPACDLNADFLIDNSDLMWFFEYQGKTTKDYPGAEAVEMD